MRNASGWKRYYFSDHLGTASLIARQDGTVQREARHYPFGEIRWESGANPTEQPFDFTGQRLERGLGGRAVWSADSLKGLFDWHERVW